MRPGPSWSFGWRPVVDYGLDGLKIDVLEQAMVYRGTPSGGDHEDVGEAMHVMLE